MSEISVALCQTKSVYALGNEDPRPQNLAKLRETMREAARKDAQLAVFGEIFLNGYASGRHSARLAIRESSDDPIVQEVSATARETGQTVVVGATTFKDTSDEVYNSALVIDGSGLRGTYNKAHVPAMVGPNGTIVAERAWWAPGSAIEPIQTEVGSLGIEICYDIIFPETARTLSLKGADLVINISAAVCGFEAVWDAFLPVRAIENSVSYIHVSLVGDQGDFNCFGGSRVFSPSGNVTAELPRNEEGLMVTSVNLEERRLARSANHTFSLRQPRLYDAISRDAE